MYLNKSYIQIHTSMNKIQPTIYQRFLSVHPESPPHTHTLTSHTNGHYTDEHPAHTEAVVQLLLHSSNELNCY